MFILELHKLPWARSLTSGTGFFQTQRAVEKQMGFGLGGNGLQQLKPERPDDFAVLSLTDGYSRVNLSSGAEPDGSCAYERGEQQVHQC